jgi:hypothetical protein
VARHAKLKKETSLFGWIQFQGWCAIAKGSFCTFLLLVLATASVAHAQDAVSLQARYAEIKPRLFNNQFQLPLFLESAQTAGDVRGDIFAVIGQPFGIVREALESVDHWCDILILHLNVKHCKTLGSSGVDRLILTIGKKKDQAVSDAYALDFAFSTAAASLSYLHVRLEAAEGPLRTKNYLIQLQAVPIDARRSFINMTYSCEYGLAARTAMKAYFATIGREKVGFSIVGHGPDGRPIYVRDVLGLVERNAMRYYLAIDAYLGTYQLPLADRVERRLRDWYTNTERYTVQLHEMERGEYLTMKRKEIRRQQSE